MYKTKTPHQKHVELINSFSKITKYKIDSQKSVAFLYTNHEPAEKIFRGLTPKNIKYLQTNLTKKVKDHYRETCVTLKTELKNSTRKWKVIHCAGRKN